MLGVSRPGQTNARAVESGFFGERKENFQEPKRSVGELSPAVEIPPTKESEQPVNGLEIELQESDRPAPVNEPESIAAEPLSVPYPVSEPVEPEVTALQKPAVPSVPAEKTARTTRESRDVQDMVEQIERVTHDHHGRGAFIRIARNVSEQDIYRALSSVRCAMDCETVYGPGAYFIRVVKAVTSFSFRGGSSSKTPPAQKKPSATPLMTLDQLQAMHAHIQVRELWKRYQQLVPDGDLERYRPFLRCHHHEVWQQEPHYRRL